MAITILKVTPRVSVDDRPKIFRVTVARKVTQRQGFKIEAADEDEARDVAERLLDLSDDEWKNEGPTWAPEISSIREVLR